MKRWLRYVNGNALVLAACVAIFGTTLFDPDGAAANRAATNALIPAFDVTLTEFVSQFESLLLNRQYQAAEVYLSQAESGSHTRPLAYFGRMLLLQSRMLEMVDSDPLHGSYEQAFQNSQTALRSIDISSLPRRQRARVIAILGGTYGLYGFFSFRQDHWASALRYGWKGVQHFNEAIQLDAQFSDPLLGIGMHEFWRSVHQRRYGVGWLFSDSTDTAVVKIEQAIQSSQYSRWAAEFSMALVRLELNQRDQLNTHIERIRKQFPMNIMIELIAATEALRSERKAKDSEAKKIFKRIQTIDANNEKARFFLHALGIKGRKNNQSAKRYFLDFISRFKNKAYRAHAFYRLGQIDAKSSPTTARHYFGEAIAIEPNFEAAKKALGALPNAEIRRPEGHPQ